MRFLSAVLLTCCAAVALLLLTGNSLAFPASADGLNALHDDSRIVVPIARNFSSFKELLQILHEDRAKYPGKPPAEGAESKELNLKPAVNGSLPDDDSYVIFVTD